MSCRTPLMNWRWRLTKLFNIFSHARCCPSYDYSKGVKIALRNRISYFLSYAKKKKKSQWFVTSWYKLINHLISHLFIPQNDSLIRIASFSINVFIRRESMLIRPKPHPPHNITPNVPKTSLPSCMCELARILQLNSINESSRCTRQSLTYFPSSVWSIYLRQLAHALRFS